MCTLRIASRAAISRRSIDAADRGPQRGLQRGDFDRAREATFDRAGDGWRCRNASRARGMRRGRPKAALLHMPQTRRPSGLVPSRCLSKAEISILPCDNLAHRRTRSRGVGRIAKRQFPDNLRSCRDCHAIARSSLRTCRALSASARNVVMGIVGHRR